MALGWKRGRFPQIVTGKDSQSVVFIAEDVS